MLQLIGCVIYYNNKSTIYNTLVSLLSTCNRVVAIDGRFENFGDSTDLVISDDGSYEIVERLSKDTNKILNIQQSKVWATEPAKRNAYIDATRAIQKETGDEDTYMFIMDGDEMIPSLMLQSSRLIINHYIKMYKGYKFIGYYPYYRVPIITIRYNDKVFTYSSSFLPRIIKFVNGMRYAGYHFTLLGPEGNPLYSQGFLDIKGVKMIDPNEPTIPVTLVNLKAERPEKDDLYHTFMQRRNWREE